jgi:hypothetical protein
MTADFHICTICGVVPLVSSEIDDQTFAVVNVNTFDNKQEFNMTVTSTDFGGEDVGSRLDRRKQNWIPAVQFEHCSN